MSLANDSSMNAKMASVINFTRNAFQKKLVETEIKNQKELARRKLDFEIIKDNFKNKATSEILTKFTDSNSKGLPGQKYKYELI